MKKVRRLLAFAACLLSMLHWALPGRAMDLVRDGRALATIVLPAGANPLTEQAADFLVRYVAEMTGAKLDILREGDARAVSGPRVFLGATEAAKAAGIDVRGLKYDGFVWRVVEGDLFIAGKDVLFAPGKDVNGFRACRGTLAGVFRLLEEYGGVRWFLPTPKGEVVPKATGFSVPDALQRKEEPVFAYIHPRLSSHGHWSWANGFRAAVNVKLHGGHSWEAAVGQLGDPKELFEKDPTIFALIKKKRYYTARNFMLCTSHPDFVEMNVEYF